MNSIIEVMIVLAVTAVLGVIVVGALPPEEQALFLKFVLALPVFVGLTVGGYYLAKNRGIKRKDSIQEKLDLKK